MEVLDQRGKPHVELGQALAALREVVAVIVPTAEADGHAAGTGLDEPSGHQEVIHAARTAVAHVLHFAVAVLVPELRVLAGDVERLDKRARRQDLEGAAGEGVHHLDRAVNVDVAAKAVEALEEPLAVVEVANAQVPRLRRVRSAPMLGMNGAVRQAEVAWVAVVGPVHMPHPGREADERRHGRVHRPLELQEDRPQAGPAPLLLTSAAG